MFKITKAMVLHLISAPLAAAAGWLTTLLANNVPTLPHISSGWLTGVFISATLGAYALAVHYLRNWAWWEKNVAPVVDVTDSEEAAQNLRQLRTTSSSQRVV